MSHEAHRSAAGTASIEVHVVVVSSTRTAATDTSGQGIASRLEAAGHHAASRQVVDDDVAAIRNVVRALAASDAQAVVLTGGTGITGRDVTPEALLPLLSPRLDGFGEQFRALSHAEIGPAAMLSRATAGLVGRTVVFAVPGSAAAGRLAIDALIGPELAHLVHLARTDRAAPGSGQVRGEVEPEVEAEFEVVGEGTPEAGAGEGRSGPAPRAGASVGLAHHGAGEAPAPVPDGDAPWRRAITAWGGTLQTGAREDLPELVERLAPAVDILHQAGAVGVMMLPDGRRYGLYGFPDLVRPSAKVIAVGHGGPLAHVLAVHRWPVVTGTCAHRGPTPTVNDDPAAVSEQIAGRPWPRTDGDTLFAVTGDTVWVLRGRRVLRWDGRSERDDGTPTQVLVSLLLDWSGR
jgi:molybdopterin adenylyltransferase